MSESEFAENDAATDGDEPTMEEILASIRRIISDDDEPETAESPAEEDDDDEEILELTEILAEEEPVEEDDIDSLLDGFDVADDELLSPDDVDDLEFSMPEEEAVVEPEPTPEPEPVVAAQPAPELAVSDSLISAQVGDQVNQNFNLLANTMLAQNGAGQTVESMVMALMRPMLKSWLDENLPVMVEKIVREEIERVARGGKM